MHDMLDFLIIGAGPAGLQLAYGLEKQGQNYLILEKADRAGDFFARYPRHRMLISVNKVYTGMDCPHVNMRHDWNSLLSEEGLLFKQYDKDYFPHADNMVRYLQDYADTFNLRIRYGSEVTCVEKDEDGFFVVKDGHGARFLAKRLIVATGVFKPYIPEIPGIELAVNYTETSVDPEDFINRRVLILGKGNSAFETADNLVSTTALIHVASPNSIRMAWKTHFVGHLRAVNNNLLDTYQLKSQNAILDAEVVQLRRMESGQIKVTFKYAHADGEVEELVYDDVICCTGFRFDDSIFAENCKPELAINHRFPAQTEEWASTNIPHLYFAGTLMQMRDFKKTTSGFVHGFRYNAEAMGRMLLEKYEGIDFPREKVAIDAHSLTMAFLDRANKSSAIWQQPSFLGDLFLLDEDKDCAQFIPSLPMDYIRKKWSGEKDAYFTVTLEFGPPIEGDPFSEQRIHRDDVKKADQSKFLHPVVRFYRGGQEQGTHHVIEDLEAIWREDSHILPLRDFLTDVLDRLEIGANV